MIQVKLKSEIEWKFKRLLKNYDENYNVMFSDIIKYYIDELKKGMKNIESDLISYESKHSLKTKEFYKKFQNGELGDENNDFIQWAGEYEIWLDHNKDLIELTW